MLANVLKPKLPVTVDTLLLPLDAPLTDKLLAVNVPITFAFETTLPLTVKLPVILKLLPTVKLPTIAVLVGKSTVIVPVDVMGLFVTSNEVLDIPTLVTPAAAAEVDTVMFPLLLLNDIPVPAFNLVTPVLIILMFPAVVIGLPDICIPAPVVVTPTLVTVPVEAAFAILVTRPYWSTVTVGYVYVPATTPLVAKSNVMIPLLMIGPPVDVILAPLPAPTTLMFETPPPPLPPPGAVIVMFPLDCVKTILLSPAVKLVTPVFVIVKYVLLLL